MTVLGTMDEWHDLLDSLMPDIVSLVIKAWNTMPAIAADAKEDPVSEELCRRLRAMKDLSKLPLQVHTQFVELETADDSEQGRIDIVFLPLVPNESIYFALECKRVNVRQTDGEIRRYFSEYVTEGLTRFVTGRYSHEVRHGGMLAFVLDGDIPSAISGIGKNIVAKRDVLQLIGTSLKRSRYDPDNDSLRETEHSRSSEAGDVVVQHFIMGSGIPSAASTG